MFIIKTTLIILKIMFLVYASITEDQLFALPKKVNQQTAVKLCQQQGMNLIKIQDEQTNQIVYNFAVKRKLGQYWIDGNDRLAEGQWAYEDGNKITYSKWQPGEPNNYHNEDCLHGSFYQNGFWNDISCNIKNAVICYMLKSNIKPVKIEEKQLVVLPDKVNQQNAVNLCTAKGLNLIKVQDEETNQMVYNFAVQKKLGQYWIDANDRQNEDSWVYENGDRIIYNKWYNGEPNNYNNEDCLHGLFYPNGFWNDISCTASNAVICYDDLSSHTKTDNKTRTKAISLYLTGDYGTYDEAVKACEEDDLKLLRIDGVEVNNYAIKLAKEKEFSSFWIDGTKRKSKDIWLDSFGKSLSYTNFKSEAINESTDALCINGYSFQNEYWNTVKCDSRHYIICYD